MIDEILGSVIGEAAFGRLSPSRRAQLLLRLFFGLLGATLGMIGAFHFAYATDLTANTAMRVSMVAVFVFLAAFCLFNVALGRTWRWPGRLFVVSFVALFGSRLLLGP